MTTKPKDIKTANGDSGDKSAKDFMTKDPKYISPKTTLREAANMMVSLGTGSLPVGNKEKLLGFITDRDIVVRAVAQGLDPTSTNIESVMTDKVLYCYEDSELKAIADNMKENEVLRLVVLDKNQMFKGIITHSHLAKASIENNDSELCQKVSALACYDKIS